MERCRAGWVLIGGPPCKTVEEAILWEVVMGSRTDYPFEIKLPKIDKAIVQLGQVVDVESRRVRLARIKIDHAQPVVIHKVHEYGNGVINVFGGQHVPLVCATIEFMPAEEIEYVDGE